MPSITGYPSGAAVLQCILADATKFGQVNGYAKSGVFFGNVAKLLCRENNPLHVTVEGNKFDLKSHMQSKSSWNRGTGDDAIDGQELVEAIVGHSNLDNPGIQTLSDNCSATNTYLVAFIFGGIAHEIDSQVTELASKSFENEAVKNILKTQPSIGVKISARKLGVQQDGWDVIFDIKWKNSEETHCSIEIPFSIYEQKGGSIVVDRSAAVEFSCSEDLLGALGSRLDSWVAKIREFIKHCFNKICGVETIRLIEKNGANDNINIFVMPAFGEKRKFNFPLPKQLDQQRVAHKQKFHEILMANATRTALKNQLDNRFAAEVGSLKNEIAELNEKVRGCFSYFNIREGDLVNEIDQAKNEIGGLESKINQIKSEVTYLTISSLIEVKRRFKYLQNFTVEEVGNVLSETASSGEKDKTDFGKTEADQKRISADIWAEHIGNNSPLTQLENPDEAALKSSVNMSRPVEPPLGASGSNEILENDSSQNGAVGPSSLLEEREEKSELNRITNEPEFKKNLEAAKEDFNLNGGSRWTSFDCLNKSRYARVWFDLREVFSPIFELRNNTQRLDEVEDESGDEINVSKKGKKVVARNDRWIVLVSPQQVSTQRVLPDNYKDLDKFVPLHEVKHGVWVGQNAGADLYYVCEGVGMMTVSELRPALEQLGKLNEKDMFFMDHKPENMAKNRDGKVRFIDCDSIMQYRDNGSIVFHVTDVYHRPNTLQICRSRPAEKLMTLRILSAADQRAALLVTMEVTDSKIWGIGYENGLLANAEDKLIEEWIKKHGKDEYQERLKDLYFMALDDYAKKYRIGPIADMLK